MHEFPMFARLAGKPCLVVGGGTVAMRKVDQLRAADARVTINAPEIRPELTALSADGVRLEARVFDPKLIDEHLLVIAATSDVAVNRRVAAAAAAAGRLCNIVDDGEASSFISPAVVRRPPLLVAVSSGGSSPVLARMLRQRIEQWLPERIGALAQWAGRLRARVSELLPDPVVRRRFWERLLDGPAAAHLIAGRVDEAERELETMLEDTSGTPARGEAWIVGAGPGDPELLTLGALRVLQQAEVILHDRLVSPAVLALARRDAEFVDVGKTGDAPSTDQPSTDQPSTDQQWIIERLIAEVRAGRRVCRLKGGDPYVFGRGGEEALALAEAGLPFRVLPGITAAAGCAAAAGIPLTHRDLAEGVSLVSARLARGRGDPDWAALARLDHTIAVYMPVRRLEDIAEALIRHGKPAATPAVVIASGTMPAQRIVAGPLERIAATARDADIGSPALLYVGAVAGLADRLGPRLGPDAERIE